MAATCLGAGPGKGEDARGHAWWGILDWGADPELRGKGAWRGDRVWRTEGLVVNSNNIFELLEPLIELLKCLPSSEHFTNSLKCSPQPCEVVGSQFPVHLETEIPERQGRFAKCWSRI